MDLDKFNIYLKVMVDGVPSASHSAHTFDELGETIQRQRILPPINASKLGIGVGKRLLISNAKFMLQTGQGLTTGQGSIPRIMIEYSIDGGDSWSKERWPEVGKLVQYLVTVECWDMVVF